MSVPIDSIGVAADYQKNTERCYAIAAGIMGLLKSTLVARGAYTPETVVASQRLQRLTWIYLHVLLNACLNHPQLAIYRAGA